MHCRPTSCISFTLTWPFPCHRQFGSDKRACASEWAPNTHSHLACADIVYRHLSVIIFILIIVIIVCFLFFFPRFNSLSCSCIRPKSNSSPRVISPNRLAFCWHSTPASSHTCSHRSTSNRTIVSHRKRCWMSTTTSTPSSTAPWPTAPRPTATRRAQKRHWTTITIPMLSIITMSTGTRNWISYYHYCI